MTPFTAYPNQYPINVDYWVRIVGPEKTKIILQFQKLDIEAQEECLYDFMGLNDVDTVLHTYISVDSPSFDPLPKFDQNYNATNLVLADVYKRITSKSFQTRDKRYWTPKAEQQQESAAQKVSNSQSERGGGGDAADEKSNHTVTEFYKVDSLKLRKYEPIDETAVPFPQLRLCGTHEAGAQTYNFISRDNEMLLHFHSDFSITGTGYTLNWNAIDVAACPIQTLTAKEGFINSPHYPHFLLNNLDCTYVIQAPAEKRILIEFSDFELVSGADVQLNLGDDFFRPFNVKRQLNDGVFVSKGEKLIVRLQTGAQPKGRGFRAIYKTSK